MKFAYFLEISLVAQLLNGTWGLGAQDAEQLLSCYGWDEQQVLPQDVFSERVAAWVSVEERHSWMELASEAQLYFQELGFDVVIYAPLAELHVGEEVRGHTATSVA